MKKSVKGETSSDPDVCDPFVSMLKNTEFPLKKYSISFKLFYLWTKQSRPFDFGVN